MNGTYVKMRSDNPYLKVFGATSAQGSTIILMNQDSLQSFPVDLARINPADKGKNEINIYAHKPIQVKFDGLIPPNATVVLTFDEKGNNSNEILYDLEMALKKLPPQITRKD
jgi:hypothetical protein